MGVGRGIGTSTAPPSTLLPVDGAVDVSWSFQYATYPFLYSSDDAIAFLGKCFLLGEELIPILANMKGVVDQVRQPALDKHTDGRRRPRPG